MLLKSSGDDPRGYTCKVSQVSRCPEALKHIWNRTLQLTRICQGLHSRGLMNCVLRSLLTLD